MLMNLSSKHIFIRAVVHLPTPLMQFPTRQFFYKFCNKRPRALLLPKLGKLWLAVARSTPLQCRPH